MARYKKALIIISIALGIFSCLFAFWFAYYTYSHPNLKAFKITRVEELDNKLVLFFNPSKNAVRYEIKMTDQYGNMIYELTTKDTQVILDNFKAKFQDEINVDVIAINRLEEKLKSSNTYVYVWQEPSFDEELTSHYILENQNLKLYLNGLNNLAEYKIKVSYRDNPILEEVVTTPEYIIPYDLVKEYSGRLIIELIKNDNWVVNTYNVYINTTIVGKVAITKPESGATRYDDIDFAFTGGGNATNYKLNIYEGKKKTNTIQVTNKEITISAQYFEPSKTYTLELLAIYEDYEEIAQSASVILEIGSKAKTNPVYTNYNWTHVKKGTKVTLNSKTPNATIYYTTDNSDPNLYGTIYKEPITIDQDMTIKTVAKSKNRYDSEINVYPFHIGQKKLVVYLSPSNQYKNLGVRKVGYTNEMEMMNKVTDVLEHKLKEAGVSVYRNVPTLQMRDWLSESRQVSSDLHFAIHSNASATPGTQGMEIFVDNQTSPALSIANALFDGLYAIYPYQSEKNNRGVKFSEGGLGETNPLNIKTGALMEIAFHDNEKDAKWMVDNIEEIATNLANTILTFYQVKE